jgi:hypothetical protein
MLKFFATVFKTLTIRLFRKSGIISEQELELFCPKAEDGRSAGRIDDSASLYRRFQPHHFDSSGILVPAYFAFPKKKDRQKSGQSFLLKGVALAFHALHRNCNDGRPLPAGEWRVWELAVEGIPTEVSDPEKKTFYFKPIHVPYSTCKAHCELMCSDRPDGLEYVVPGEAVKAKVRILLSRQFKPTGWGLVVQPLASPETENRHDEAAPNQ